MLACLRYRIARLIFLHLVMYMYMHHDWKLVWFFFINFFFNCYNIDCLFYWKRLWKKIICLHQKNKIFQYLKLDFYHFICWFHLNCILLKILLPPPRWWAGGNRYWIWSNGRGHYWKGELFIQKYHPRILVIKEFHLTWAIWFMIFVQVNKSKMHKPIYNCNFLAIYDPQPCLMTLNYRYPEILPAFHVDKFIKSSSVNITISYSTKFLG